MSIKTDVKFKRVETGFYEVIVDGQCKAKIEKAGVRDIRWEVFVFSHINGGFWKIEKEFHSLADAKLFMRRQYEA